MITPLRTVIAYTPAVGRNCSSTSWGRSTSAPQSSDGRPSASGLVWSSTTTISGRPDRAPLPSSRRQQCVSAQELIVSPTDPSDTRPGARHGTGLRLGRRDAAPTSRTSTDPPSTGCGPYRWPCRPTTRTAPLAADAPSGPNRRGRLPTPVLLRARCGRTRQESSAAPTAPTAHHRRRAGRPPTGVTLRITRPSTSRCPPDTRPSFNDTPNSGTAAAVSARCNNRPPSRTDVFAASASDFSGNDDTAAIR